MNKCRKKEFVFVSGELADVEFYRRMCCPRLPLPLNLRRRNRKVESIWCVRYPIEEPWDGVIHTALLKAKDEAGLNTPIPKISVTQVIWNACCAKYASSRNRISSSVMHLATKKLCAVWLRIILKLPLSLALVLARRIRISQCLITGSTNRLTWLVCWLVDDRQPM
jgi:hypothetical protein